MNQGKKIYSGYMDPTYLSSKVKEAQTRFVSLILSPDEIRFLRKHHITFYRDAKMHRVNTEQLKALFCQ